MDDFGDYDVHLTPEGSAQCSCPDYIFARQNHGEDCKHISAMRYVNLLPSE